MLGYPALLLLFQFFVFSLVFIQAFQKVPITSRVHSLSSANTYFHATSPKRNSINIISSRLYSTVIAPPKVDKPAAPTTTPNPTKTPAIPRPDILFKESIDIQKEFDESEFSDMYMVVLFNDPYNKRQYVSQVLMEVFSWTEVMASDVMMQAHTYGYAVTGEWAKTTAQEYCDKLVDKGLFAEVVKVGDGSDEVDEFDNNENAFQ